MRLNIILKSFVFLILVMLGSGFTLFGQENYEIQVYDSKTIGDGITIFELHSNYTLHGITALQEGVQPTNHALHETVEITHGFNPYFEVGFYQFMTRNLGNDFSYVGNHIRPRVCLPESCGWPVGLSLSTEVGYQRAQYSSSTWSLEIRPIIDRLYGKWDFSVNPVVELALKGPAKNEGAVFSPNAKVTYAVTSLFNAGFEYYGSMGPLHQMGNLNTEPQQLALAFNFFFAPEWEFNIGYVKGLTASVESDIVKCYLGRRFGMKKS